MWQMSSHVVSSSSYLLPICSASLSDSSSFFSCCFSIYHLIFFTLARCCFLWCALNSTEATSTVVPVLGDPRRERPPAVYGHVVNVPTYVNVKLPLIHGHLPNADADSHLLVVSTCYNGQCKQMPYCRWSFQPKIAGAHPNLGPTVRSNFRAAVW